MAHLSITIDEKTDLISIGTDRLNDLTVNGVDYYNGPFAQKSAGEIQFSVGADSIGLTNPDTVLYVKNTAGTKTYVCWIGFTGDANSQTIYGMVRTVNALLREAKSSSSGFNQGNLNGSIEVK